MWERNEGINTVSDFHSPNRELAYSHVVQRFSRYQNIPCFPNPIIKRQSNIYPIFSILVTWQSYLSQASKITSLTMSWEPGFFPVRVSLCSSICKLVLGNFMGHCKLGNKHFTATRVPCKLCRCISIGGVHSCMPW